MSGNTYTLTQPDEWDDARWAQVIEAVETFITLFEFDEDKETE